MASGKSQVAGRKIYVSRITYYVSRLTYHVLRITYYVSRITSYAIRNILQSSIFHLPSSIFTLLLLFTLFTLFNSIRLPLGEAPDETDHYQYHRFVARSGHPPLTEAERKEAGFKGGLAPLYYWLTAWPIALVGEETVPDVRRIDARPERFIPTDGLGINRVLHTLDEQWPWRGQPLAWHLVRLLSLPMAWVTLTATYALARHLVPDQKSIALGAVAFMAFLPRFVISSAVINDDNLVFPLIALLLLVQVIILQGDHRPRLFAALGALFGLALVTKYFSLILAPEILFTLFMAWRHHRAEAQRRRGAGEQLQQSTTHYALRTTYHASRITFYAPTFAFFLALLLTAGPWFLFISLRFNRIAELGPIPGLAAALGEPQITEGLVGLLSGQTVRPPAATYPLLEWFSLLYRSFWFEYGWMRIFAPTWVYGLFTVFLGIAVIGLILKSREMGRRGDKEIDEIGIDRRPMTNDERRTANKKARTTHYALRTTFPILILFTLHLALFLAVVLSRYVLSATIDTGQGRHLYPALPVIAIGIAMGLNHLRFLILNFGLARSSAPNPKPVTGLLLRSPAPLLLCYLLLAIYTLLPATIILPHYPTLPITITPPETLSISHRQIITINDDFFLAGLDTAEIVSAGETLPVRLYWRIDNEVNQDYLVSLCLQDESAQPAACWWGHFADGRYPARAWEAGDTLADTIYLPIPTCYRLTDQAYHLHLDLWPLRPDALIPTPEATPLIQHTFADPVITIRPTDSLLTDLPQEVDLWRGDQRLTTPAAVAMNQTLTQITYRATQEDTPQLIADNTGSIWPPLTALETDSYLPCGDGPTPFARLSPFIADASLSPQRYRSTAKTLPDLTIDHLNRSRTFAPLTASRTFNDTLSPLSLQLPDQSVINLPTSQPSHLPITNYQLPISNLPISIRWQTRRWMADPLVISLKLLDKDFAIGGERIATLGDRYPNVLWAPTEVIEETYPLQIKPDAPPGLYQLELSLIRQDKTLPDGFEYLPLLDAAANLGHNLYPLTLRLLDPAHNTSPPHPFQAQLGEAIHLTGYNLQSPNSNPSTTLRTSLQSPISLSLYWQSTAVPTADYTVFTQLIGPDGQAWAQWDNPPQAGRYPTTAWRANDKIVDRYNLSLREGAPSGDYRLLVGMYDPSTGERLPATIDGQPQPDNAIELTKLTIMP